MIRTILQKEFDENRFLLALICFFHLLFIGGILITFSVGVGPKIGEISLLEMQNYYLFFINIFFSLIITSSLISKDFYSPIYHFLRGLPLSPWKLILSKWMIGFWSLLFLNVITFFINFIYLQYQEYFTFSLILISTLRVFSFSFFIFNTSFFLMAFGKYKYPAFFFLSSVLILQLGEGEWLAQFAPIRLMADDQISLEREIVPTLLIFLSFLYGLGVLILGSLLIHFQLSGWQPFFMGKLTTKEKLATFVILLLGSYAALSLDNRTLEEPFRFINSHDTNDFGIFISIEKNRATPPKLAIPLQKELEEKLSGLQQKLGLQEFPRIYLSHQNSLDLGYFQKGKIKAKDGILIRGNFSQGLVEQEKFYRHLLGNLFFIYSKDGVALEKRRLVVDSFLGYWMLHSSGKEDLEYRKKLTLRALYGEPDQWTLKEFLQWSRLSEQKGECIIDAIAWHWMEVFQDNFGQEALWRIYRRVLAEGPTNGFESLISSNEVSVAQLLKEEGGISLESFFSLWKKQLKLDREKYKVELQGLPRITLQTGWKTKQELKNQPMQYQVTISPSPQQETNFMFRYRKIPPYDYEIDYRDTFKEEHLYTTPEKKYETRQLHYPQDRWSYTASLENQELDCRIIAGWTREKVL